MTRRLHPLILVLLAAGLAAACGPSQSPTAGAAPAVAKTAFEGPVPRAQCGADDRVETGLQGQVSQSDQLSGRALEGYNCNLELVGQSAGEGASWQFAWFEDCGYYDTATVIGAAPGAGTKPGQLTPGVAVVDASDSSNPTPSDYLDTVSMVDPWESLKVNERRKLLGAVQAYVGGASPGTNGGTGFDLYDLSGDCRQPQLISSLSLPEAENVGHEGNFAPDGLTYYGSSLLGGDGGVYPIDISDPANPRALFHWVPPDGGQIHGMGFSEDGMRGYLANTAGNGLLIVDTSDVQLRRPNPDIRVISSLTWTDGSTAQHAIPVRIGGRPYVIFVDELGKGAARVIDISDERNPFIVSKLKLEVQMPENAEAVQNDLTGSVPFGYDAHYCGVDDPADTTMVACGYFVSGIRVFDVRNPALPREIAYYIPPANPGYHPGSNFSLNGNCEMLDWASSQVRFRLDRGELWFTTQCNGFQIVKFTNGVLPLAPLAPAEQVAGPAEDESRFGGALGALSLLLGFAGAALRRGCRNPLPH